MSDCYYVNLSRTDLTIASNDAGQSKALIKKGGAQTIWQACALLPIQRLSLVLESEAAIHPKLLKSLLCARSFLSCFTILIFFTSSTIDLVLSQL